MLECDSQEMLYTMVYVRLSQVNVKMNKKNFLKKDIDHFHDFII